MQFMNVGLTSRLPVMVLKKGEIFMEKEKNNSNKCVSTTYEIDGGTFHVNSIFSDSGTTVSEKVEKMIKHDVDNLVTENSFTE